MYLFCRPKDYPKYISKLFKLFTDKSLDKITDALQTKDMHKHAFGDIFHNHINAKDISKDQKPFLDAITQYMIDRKVAANE